MREAWGTVILYRASGCGTPGEKYVNEFGRSNSNAMEHCDPSYRRVFGVKTANESLKSDILIRYLRKMFQ